MSDKTMMNKARDRSSLTRNRWRCIDCDTIIESVERHDYVRCSCGQGFCDGGVGSGYIRTGGNLESLCEYVTELKLAQPVYDGLLAMLGKGWCYGQDGLNSWAKTHVMSSMKHLTEENK
jgi:hypothetical protein